MSDETYENDITEDSEFETDIKSIDEMLMRIHIRIDDFDIELRKLEKFLKENKFR